MARAPVGTAESPIEVLHPDGPDGRPVEDAAVFLFRSWLTSEILELRDSTVKTNKEAVEFIHKYLVGWRNLQDINGKELVYPADLDKVPIAWQVDLFVKLSEVMNPPTEAERRAAKAVVQQAKVVPLTDDQRVSEEVAEAIVKENDRRRGDPTDGPIPSRERAAVAVPNE